MVWYGMVWCGVVMMPPTLARNRYNVKIVDAASFNASVLDDERVVV